MTNKSTIPTFQLQMEFDEEWRDVPGFEEYYEVSNKGRVRTKKAKLRGYPVGTLIKQTNANDGYLAVTLNGNGKERRYYVHQVVMLAFVGEPGDLEVNHIDGIKSNNVLENLEYVTHQTNLIHAIHTLKRQLGARGALNHESKLNPDMVREIRARRAAGEGYKSIAKDYPVSASVIRQVDRREIWKWVEG